MTHVCAIRDGARIAYTDDGTGDPAIVLVHGWCCDRSYLEPQRAHFAARHRVIALDLPGHGDSDAPRRDYTIPAFARDVAWLIGELGLARPIVIGHSMGGAIALELAADPGLASGVVILDTSIAPSAATQAAWAGLIADLAGSTYREAAAELIGRVYFQTGDDDARKARIIAAMTATPQLIMRQEMESIAAWDSEAAAAAARTPALYIGSSAPRGDVARFHALCPQLVSGQVVGSGHFVQLEVPEQVNAMIERFLLLAGLSE